MKKYSNLIMLILCIGLTSAISCYQETANQSTIGDGICGLNYTGSYSGSGWQHSSSLLYDGNWSSSDGPPRGYYGYLFIDYTKPVNSSSAKWEVGTQDALSYSYTLPITSSCWNADANKISLKLVSYHQNIDFYCKNSIGWEKLYRWVPSITVKISKFREEGITWEISSKSIHSK